MSASEGESSLDEQRDDVRDDDYSSDSSHGDSPTKPTLPNPSPSKADNAQSTSLFVETAFDAYFKHTSSRSHTSFNVFSQHLLPLTPEEHKAAISKLPSSSPSAAPTELHQDMFPRYLWELHEGFNLLFYGYGSKRQTLNQFATEYCSKHGHVIVANAFHPDFSLKDIFNPVHKIPGFQDLDLAPTAIEKQARRIYDFFSQPTSKRHLYIVIHNIDAAPLRSAKAKSILSLLAMNPRIHIAASIDHINAPLIWTSSECSSRKPGTADDIADAPSARGFAWLWHDLTTLAPYDFELTFTDKSSLSGAHGGGLRRRTDALAAQSATAMTETAALHILASVTQKAQKLFALLGNKQLESIEAVGEYSSSDELQQHAMGYDMLFNLARDNFVATNETALRALLGEFRDHGLVLSAQNAAAGGEVLWIPLRKERLASVLQHLKQEHR